MEASDRTGDYKVSSSEVRRAQIGAFLLGRSLGLGSDLMLNQGTTTVQTNTALDILSGNIVLLHHIEEVQGQGVTHLEELKEQAARTVRSGVVALELDQQ